MNPEDSDVEKPEPMHCAVPRLRMLKERENAEREELSSLRDEVRSLQCTNDILQRNLDMVISAAQTRRLPRPDSRGAAAVALISELLEASGGDAGVAMRRAGVISFDLDQWLARVRDVLNAGLAEGWQMVPVSPTKPMEYAIANFLENVPRLGNTMAAAAKLYQLILDMAPTPAPPTD